VPAKAVVTLAFLLSFCIVVFVSLAHGHAGGLLTVDYIDLGQGDIFVTLTELARTSEKNGATTLP
jgi:hypothetical protein